MAEGSKKILIRVIGAPLLLAVLGGFLYLGYRHEQKGEPNTFLPVLLCVVGLGCLSEYFGFAKVKGIRAASAPATFGILAFFFPLSMTGYWRGGLSPLEAWALVLAVVFLCVAFLLVFRYGVFLPEGAAFSLFGYVYISLLGFLLFPPVGRSVSTFYLLFLLACGKGSDMAAFVVGKAIGKHKMTPVVSPNKTWEGGIAGGIAGTAAGLAILLKTPLAEGYRGIPVAALLLFALVVTIAAQVGDLVKSAFKRWAGVKDSGKLLPEFGGMLDMVDSFLIAAPVAHLGTEVLRRVFG